MELWLVGKGIENYIRKTASFQLLADKSMALLAGDTILWRSHGYWKKNKYRNSNIPLKTLSDGHTAQDSSLIIICPI